MIEISVLHSFVLVGSRGERTPLVTADLDDRDIGEVATEAATAAVSPSSDPDDHARIREAAIRAFERLEAMPGTAGMAGERLPGDRLVRVFRHLAGEGSED